MIGSMFTDILTLKTKKMEIKLNAGDNLVIPAGCKATVNNGIILIEKN